ncbi:CbtB domain-containing protein [Rhodovibrionaceae bacterium A322]
MNLSATTTNTATQSRSSAVLAASVALLFGVFMIYGIGFAQSQEVHNAAHDTRHANAFPCH